MASLLFQTGILFSPPVQSKYKINNNRVVLTLLHHHNICNELGLSI